MIKAWPLETKCIPVLPPTSHVTLSNLLISVFSLLNGGNILSHRVIKRLHESTCKALGIAPSTK